MATFQDSNSKIAKIADVQAQTVMHLRLVDLLFLLLLYDTSITKYGNNQQQKNMEI